MAKKSRENAIRNALVSAFHAVTVPRLKAREFYPSPMLGDAEGLNDGFYQSVHLRMDGDVLQRLSFTMSGADRSIGASLNLVALEEKPTSLDALDGASAVMLEIPPFVETREYIEDYLPIPFLWIARSHAIADDIEPAKLQQNATAHAEHWSRQVENIEATIAKWRERHVMLTTRVTDLRADAEELLKRAKSAPT